MNKIKLILLKFPECYLLVLVLLAGYTPPTSVNPLALIFAVVLLIQIIFRNRILGLFMAGIFALISIYMLLALVSEFNEAATFKSENENLLVGLPIFALNMAAISLMICKYFFRKEFQSDHRRFSDK